MIRGVRRVIAQPSGEVQFTESTASWTTPTGVRKIKVFVVGGGASGGWSSTPDTSGSGYGGSGGCGGGSGYTTTQEITNITVPKELSITIGSGGASFSAYDSRPTGGQNAGNASSVTGDGVSISANGGKGGGTSSTQYGRATYRSRDCETGADTYSTDYSCICGSNGGSGGGCGYEYWSYGIHGPSSGKTDGNGGSEDVFSYHPSSSGHDHYLYYRAGYGQGTTTRAYGESAGTLFASGGTGCANYSATANTGNGGHGMSYSISLASRDRIAGAGGSGIVLIKWTRGGR